MREQFQSELENLDARLIEMTKLASKAMVDATTALTRTDLALAESVIAADEEIDRLQRDVDETAVTLLARQSPVATDLRVVVTSLRMSSTIERMGDLARHVAELVRLRFPAPVVPDALADVVTEMGATAHALAVKAGRVLETRDVELAAQVEIDDDALDALHQKVFDALASGDWAESVSSTVDVTLLSRYFERYGDHAVSLAERMQFLVTGQWDLAADGASTPHAP